MKNCETCLHRERGMYNDTCDACLSNPDVKHQRWVHKDWRDIFDRVKVLADTIGALSSSGLAVGMIRSYAEEILIHCDELEGKDKRDIFPTPSDPRPIKDEYTEQVVYMNGEKRIEKVRVVHGTVDVETGEVRKK